jgi:hypothetical protein
MPRFYRSTVDLFSPDEHAVLADWLGVRPPKCAKGIDPADAMARLGFEKEPSHYRLIDAVVAFIVLENAEKRLPGWSALRADGSFVCALAYYLTWLPRYDHFVVTASADCPGARGSSSGGLISSTPV